MTIAKVIKYPGLLLIGGLLYAALELAFRGRTHWSMGLAGGVSTVLLYLIAVKNGSALWEKWIMGGAVITTVEFLFGAVFNLKLKLGVWNYSHMPLNLFGQICPLFTLLWIGLSALAMPLLTVVDQRFFHT